MNTFLCKRVNFLYGQNVLVLPFLLVADASQTGSCLVLSSKIGKTDDILVSWVDRLGKRNVARSVLVAIVDYSVIRKRCQIRKRCDHLVRCALEESAAASDEERIACEYTAWMELVHGVSYMITDRVLSVARSCQASVVILDQLNPF